MRAELARLPATRDSARSLSTPIPATQRSARLRAPFDRSRTDSSTWEAIMGINVDVPIPEEVMKKIMRAKGVTDGKFITLW